MGLLFLYTLLCSTFLAKIGVKMGKLGPTDALPTTAMIYNDIRLNSLLYFLPGNLPLKKEWEINDFTYNNWKTAHYFYIFTKRFDFFWFYSYLCHVLFDVFLCFVCRSSKISGIFDMTNPWGIFCCPSYSNNIFLQCCGFKVYNNN